MIASQQSECRRYSGNLFRITGAGVVTTVAGGALDLTLMFRAQDIVSGINPVQDRELRVLRLTGSLRPHAGKKPIKGEDGVFVRGR